MPNRFRPLGASLVLFIVTVLSLSAHAAERQIVDCRVHKIVSAHEFEEGLDARHNPNVDLFQSASKLKHVLQFGAFQDFDTSRGDRIETARTRDLDSVYARYREHKWMVQIFIARDVGKSGYRPGRVYYQEDPKSKPVLVALLNCQ